MPPQQAFSLEQLISTRQVSARVLWLMQQPALEALVLAADEQGRVGEFSARSFTFDAAGRQVAFVPAPGAPLITEAQAVRNYGAILQATLAASGTSRRRLQQVASQCAQGHITSLTDAHLTLERTTSAALYWALIAVIAAVLLILALGPKP